MKPRTVHFLRVWSLLDNKPDQACYLFLSKRTPKKLKAILSTITPIKREKALKSWSIPDEYVDMVVAVLTSDKSGNANTNLCVACANGKPCDVWEDLPLGDGFAEDRVRDKDRKQDVFDEAVDLFADLFGDDSLINNARQWAQKLFGGAGAPPVMPAVAVGMSKLDAALILGVTIPVSQPELTKAFKTAAMKYHPDKGGTDEQMRKIIQARDVLMVV
jgi:DnaJ domain